MWWLVESVPTVRLWYSRRRSKRWLLLVPLFLSLVVTASSSSQQQQQQQDLYALLGVSESATTAEIKAAYRRKARDTHPDKNRDRDPEEAAAAFRQVVDAFEVLSDPAARRDYNWIRQHGGGGGRGGGTMGRGTSFTYHFRTRWTGRQRQRLRDKLEVKQAMARVLHVSTLEHFETVMMDDGRLERHVLIAIFTAPLESHLDDEMVFPYPFAGMSSQGIWWEEILQTIKVKYHRSNDMAEHFGLPFVGDAAKDMVQPVFLFGRKGQTLYEPWERLDTRNRAHLEKWMWKQIQVEVHFVNQHSHPVELFWIHGTGAQQKEVIAVGETAVHTTMLTHEWWARDIRTDARPDSPSRKKLTEASCLASWKIQNATTPQTLVIETPLCFDLSGHCPYWRNARRGKGCEHNPNYMCEYCQSTCQDFCKTCQQQPTPSEQQQRATSSTSNPNSSSQAESERTGQGEEGVHDEL